MKRRGRRRKETKSKCIAFRLSGWQLEELEKEAADEGLSVHLLAKELVVEYILRQRVAGMEIR